jgi:hypothetical protein
MLRESESARSPAQCESSPVLLGLYVFVVVLLLPMDWFGPTGMLFREFGAKPATLVLTLGGIYGMAFVRTSWRPSENSVEFIGLVIFSAWLALGFLAALANFMGGWGDWHSDRSPLGQLITQSAMVVVCAIAVIGNARIIGRFPAVSGLVARYLPMAMLLHLLVFGLNAANVLPSTSAVMLPFRALIPHDTNRPTGLFSEPAYFGTFAALYGAALLSFPVSRIRKSLYVLLALAAFAASIAIGAKTFVVVLGAQAMYFILHRTRSLLSGIASAFLLLAIVGCAIYFIQVYSALDVRSNLSSADRLGSAVLASNVALHGYGLPGIGFGQFHFFYRDRFAPDFLFLSKEASRVLSADGENRASTYNFYVRVLLETGLTGFLLFIAAIRKLWSTQLTGRLAYAPMLFAGALGFLMTQDTYFYPPLVFSSAVIMAVMESRRSESAEAAGHTLAVM